MAQFKNLVLQASAGTLSELPEDIGAEVAFLGRSNAGKSTLLNTLAGEKTGKNE